MFVFVHLHSRLVGSLRLINLKMRFQRPTTKSPPSSGVALSLGTMLHRRTSDTTVFVRKVGYSSLFFIGLHPFWCTGIVLMQMGHSNSSE